MCVHMFCSYNTLSLRKKWCSFKWVTRGVSIDRKSWNHNFLPNHSPMHWIFFFQVLQISIYGILIIFSWYLFHFCFFVCLFCFVFTSTADSGFPTLSIPEGMSTGKKVTTTCSVLHSCPSDPPNLTWSHKGALSSQSLQQSNGQWKITSSLSFTPSKIDHKKTLRCTAVFTGDKKFDSMKTLEVKCKWFFFSRTYILYIKLKLFS